MLYGKCAMLEVDLIEFRLDLLKLSLKLLNAFLSLLLDLTEANDLTLGLLRLKLNLVHL